MKIRWDRVWVSIPESQYVQSPDEADALAARLERTVAKLRRVAKHKRDSEGSTR